MPRVIELGIFKVHHRHVVGQRKLFAISCNKGTNHENSTKLKFVINGMQREKATIYFSSKICNYETWIFKKVFLLLRTFLKVCDVCELEGDTDNRFLICKQTAENCK